MKEWREFSVEDGDSWLILAEKNEPIDWNGSQSKNPTTKEKATFCISRRPGDYVSVSLISASQEFDSVTGVLGYEKYFYIKIECLKDGWWHMSTQMYKKEEALKIAKIFMGLKKI